MADIDVPPDAVWFHCKQQLPNDKWVRTSAPNERGKQVNRWPASYATRGFAGQRWGAGTYYFTFTRKDGRHVLSRTEPFEVVVSPETGVPEAAPPPPAAPGNGAGFAPSPFTDPEAYPEHLREPLTVFERVGGIAMGLTESFSARTEAMARQTIETERTRAREAIDGERERCRSALEMERERTKVALAEADARSKTAIAETDARAKASVEMMGTFFGGMLKMDQQRQQANEVKEIGAALDRLGDAIDAGSEDYQEAMEEGGMFGMVVQEVRPSLERISRAIAHHIAPDMVEAEATVDASDDQGGDSGD